MKKWEKSTQPWKLWLNLGPFRWLSLNHRLERNVISSGQHILYIGLGVGRQISNKEFWEDSIVFDC